jgi:hypothetical protein
MNPDTGSLTLYSQLNCSGASRQLTGATGIIVGLPHTFGARSAKNETAYKAELYTEDSIAPACSLPPNSERNFESTMKVDSVRFAV